MEILKKESAYFKSQLIKFIILFFISTFLFSCSFGKHASSRSNQAAEINFFDSSSYDFKLSSAMKNSQQQVITHFVSPVDINNIPKRLDKWFCSVEEFGGRIELEAEGPKPKGLVSELISLAVGTYDMIKEKNTYKPANKYNAKIYYNSSNGIISRIVFEKKSENEDAQ